MKKVNVHLIIALLLVVTQASAQLLIDAENASFNYKRDLIDNGRTLNVSRNGMINATGEVWDQALLNSNNCFISTANRAGGHSIAYYCEPTTSTYAKQRIEHYYQEGYNLTNGLEHYTGFSLYLAPGNGWSGPTSWFNIHQLLQEEGGYAPILLHFKGNGTNTLAMRYYSGTDGYDGRYGKAFDITTLQQGVWYDILVGWKWSPWSTDGFMYVWIKQANQSTYTRYGVNNIKLGYSNQTQKSIFSSVGMYRDKVNQSNKLYFDELRFSNNIESAKIPGSTISNPPSSSSSSSSSGSSSGCSGVSLTVQAESFTNTGGFINDAAWGGPGLGANIAESIINWVNNGDWIDYTVNIPAAGSYSVSYQISSPISGSTIKISGSGSSITTTVPNNGSWDSYTSLNANATLNLNAGIQTIRLTAGAQTWTWNLDNFTLSCTDKNVVLLDESASCKMYPNPAQDIIHLQLNAFSLKNANVRIYNTLGNLITYEQVTQTNHSIAIDHLAPGSYLLQVIDGNQVYTQRFIKE